MSGRITHKIIYSGCNHDPEQTSKGFCWQCRIAELEAKVVELEATIERVDNVPVHMINIAVSGICRVVYLSDLGAALQEVSDGADS